MKPVATYQKIRGGYYTPKPIADFLAQWAIQSPDTHVLEPSCGDGMLLEAAANTLIDRGAERAALQNLVQGIELDPQEAQKAAERLQTLSGTLSPVQIHVGDFLPTVKKTSLRITFSMQLLAILHLFVTKTSLRIIVG